MEDFERYLNEIVDPTIKDLEDNPTSVRHAFLACVVTFHAIDYLAHPRSSRGLRQEYRRRSKDFETVDQVAHAFKHVVTGGNGKKHLRAADVIRRPPARIGEMVIGLSKLGDSCGGVTIKKDINCDLLAVVKRAQQFLHDEIRPSVSNYRKK